MFKLLYNLWLILHFVTNVVFNEESPINTNGRDVQRKCCKQCGQVKFMGTMKKWPVQNTQNITKHGVYKDATDIKK